jgi:4-hydroxy-tetrahydrodipicolinate synthase
VKDLVSALQTVVAIPVTPFDDGDAVDEAAYAAVCERMVDNGITALTPNGNTGEFYSLSDDEAARCLAVVLRCVGDRVLVVPGVGHDVARAAAMARAAQRAGAPAVMVHQPVHPYRSVRGWVDYHRAVSDAAPEVGIVSYVRDPAITEDALMALAQACPRLVAIKYAIPDVFALQRAIAKVGQSRVAWICGLAERWAPFHWLSGARGFTSGLANVAPGLSVQLLELLAAGAMDEAMQLWRLIVPMEQIRARRHDANNVSAIKEALAQLSLTSARVRPPISELDDDERKEIAGLLAAWGVAAVSR